MSNTCWSLPWFEPSGIFFFFGSSSTLFTVNATFTSKTQWCCFNCLHKTLVLLFICLSTDHWILFLPFSMCMMFAFVQYLCRFCHNTVVKLKMTRLKVNRHNSQVYSDLFTGNKWCYVQKWTWNAWGGRKTRRVQGMSNVEHETFTRWEEDSGFQVQLSCWVSGGKATEKLIGTVP